MRTHLAIGLMTVGITLSSGAAAQSNVHQALAETLFREGRTELSQGNFESACPKFERSHRLDPSAGALANLALCHESLGRLTTAWLEYLEVGRMARDTGNQELADFAKERAEDLFPKLPRLTIRTPSGGSADLEITLDGVRLDPSALNVATPVDPGEHRIAARAPDRVPWSTSARAEPGRSQSVTVPPLALVERATPPPTSHWRTHVAIGVGATGVLLAGSVVTSVLAHRRAEHFSDINGDPAYTPSEWSAARDSARTHQLINLGFFGATAVAGAVTALLYFQRPEEHQARVAPWVSKESAGVGVSGVFQ